MKLRFAAVAAADRRCPDGSVKTGARERARPAGRMIIPDYPGFGAAGAFLQSAENGAIMRRWTDNAAPRLMMVAGVER